MANNSLQQITDAWGKWAANKYGGGGIKYTASTNYKAVSSLANDPQIGKYMKYQVTATTTDLTYGRATSIAPGNSVTNTQGTSDNFGTTTITDSVSFTLTTTQTASWSVTEAVEVGLTLTYTAKSPVSEAGGSVTASLTVSSTQGSSSSIEKSWTKSLSVPVPPGQRDVVQFTVNTLSSVVPWTSSVTLEGKVAVWFNNKIKLGNSSSTHNLYFVPIEDVFQDCIENGFIDTTGYTVAGHTVLAACAGSFSASGGISYNTKSGEVPAGSPPNTLPAAWTPTYSDAATA